MPEQTPVPTWAADIISAVRYPLEVQRVEAGHFYIVPRPDGEVERINLTNDNERYYGGLLPIAKKGEAVFTDALSFIDYAKTHGKENATEFFADLKTFHIKAVLNGHSRNDDVAGYGNHRARLVLSETDEWMEWKTVDRQWMSQEDFASFLDQNKQDIEQPETADLLEAVQNLTIHTSAVFQTKVKLSQGYATFSYAEDQGPAQSMSIPETLYLAITPFHGGETRLIEVSIRWKFQNDKDKKALHFRVLLNRPNNVARDEFLRVCNLVQRDTTLPVYFGTAPNSLV